MKKVRLFAVAAAMGMFASTVAAAEPVVSTGYVANWDGVEEIIKVDVGNKVVAPVSTIKVVKETRTTDKEDALDADHLNIALDVECYVGNTDVVGTDKNNDNYTDSKLVFINKGTEAGYFTSVEEAVNVLLANGSVLAPNAAERKEVTYANKYTGETFTTYEEVLAYAEEAGFISYVYDKDGELTDVILNATEVTDKNGNVKATVAKKVTLGTSRYAEEETLEAIAKSLVSGTLPTSEYYTAKDVVKHNYVKEDHNVTPLTYKFSFEKDGSTHTRVLDTTYPVLVVEENRYGEYAIVGRFTETDAEQYKHANGTNVEIDGNKFTVLVREEAERGSTETHFYNKLMTITPVTAKKWTAKAEMVWDEEVGSFVKEELSWDNYTANSVSGFWWGNEVDWNDEAEEEALQAKQFAGADYIPSTLGLVEVGKAEANTSDKYVITSPVGVSALNTKNGTMTITYTSAKDNSTKELTVAAVKLDDKKWYPAVNTEAELVAVMAKLNNIGEFDAYTDDADGLLPDYIDYVNGDKAYTDLDAADKNLYSDWYERTEKLAANPFSGFEFEGELPVNEYRGAESKQCTYKVASGEEVTAEVSASEVDTVEAGVKTMTLTASVDGKAVATKDVKVVVAPRYERQYLNGKVVVLKAYYAKAEKVLYSEYHYDWANGTYTATFYANDGVTVASTASGSLN